MVVDIGLRLSIEPFSSAPCECKGSWPHCELEVAGKGSSCCLEVVGYAQDTHLKGWKSKSGGVDAKVQ